MLIHAFVTFPIAYIRGIGDWSVPLVNLSLSFILWASEYVSQAKAASIMRRTIYTHS